MPEFFKNRRNAIIICVVVIILSTCFSAHRSLSELKNEVETLFITGVDGGGAGIDTDLLKRVDYAGNLITIAKKYTGFEGEIEALEQARADLVGSHGGADEKFTLNNTLSDSFDRLNSVMAGTLEEKDEKYRVEISNNFRSREDTLTREAARYNAKVREFNYNVLGTFPAMFLKYPAFVGELALFG